MTLHDIAAGPEATEVRLGDWCVRSFDVRGRRAVVIACVAGTLLVTLEGDPVDHLLSPGESLTAGRRGRVVVAGIGPSAVRLQICARAPGRRAGHPADAPADGVQASPAARAPPG